MTGITIVTGSPGAGKTTLARRASEASPRGLHLLADVFYTFPAHAIAPVLPEAHAQNAAVIAAVTRAAAAFEKLGEYASHALDTTALTVEESIAEFTRRRAMGVFALNLGRVHDGA